MLNAGNVVVLPPTTTTPLGASEAEIVPLVKPGPPGDRVEAPITMPDASPVIVSSGLTLICTGALVEVAGGSLVVEKVSKGKVVELLPTTTTPSGARDTETVPLVNPGPPGDRMVVPTIISEAFPVIFNSGLTVI